MAGESFTEAVSRYPALFPPLYVALVRVGEASGKLEYILEMLGEERTRVEALRRRLSDALRYPAFVLFAASCVLMFFLWFVLPQFATVLRDFNVKLDPIVAAFIEISEFLQENTRGIMAAVVIVLAGTWLLLRQSRIRATMTRQASRLPVVRGLLTFHHTALFCRNLNVLLASGITLTGTLRILSDIMTKSGNDAGWREIVDRVRHGGRLSDALADASAVPVMAIRMLRLGEETGQLPMLAGKVAEFYELKLQNTLGRLVGIVGPVAIITISVIVGGLIVSVMTALLSVSQIIT
jgi:general secretion pathway protein F